MCASNWFVDYRSTSQSSSTWKSLHTITITIITISSSSTSHHHHHKQHHQNHPLFSSSSPPKAQLGVITRSAAVQLIGYWSALISAADKAQQGTGYDRDDQIIPPLLLLSIFFRFLKKSKTLCLPLFCIFQPTIYLPCLTTHNMCCSEFDIVIVMNLETSRPNQIVQIWWPSQSKYKTCRIQLYNLHSTDNDLHLQDLPTWLTFLTFPHDITLGRARPADITIGI